MKKKSATTESVSNNTYQAAWDELQAILQRLQQENPDLDTLEKDVSRAHELVTFCRERLRKTEAELAQLISG